MIEELCSKLAQKRKELDLSIEEVVEKTKLYPSVIRDIEAGNLSNIEPAYLKGFIKIYASFLGIGIGDTFSQISAKAPAKERRIPDEKINRTRTIRPIIKPIPPEIKKIVIFSLLALFILWSLIVLGRFLAIKISQFPKKGVHKIGKNIPQVPLHVKPKNIIVSVSAKRNCFLRAKVDGKLVFEGILRKGPAEIWKASKEIEFRISDGSAVYLEVNGKPLPPLTSMRKSIKTLKITASGISVVK